MQPNVALAVFDDLSAAKRSLNLETDLHLIFLCTPINDGGISWSTSAEIISDLGPELMRVAQTCNVDEYLTKRITRVGKPGNSTDLNVKRKMQIFERFAKVRSFF